MSEQSKGFSPVKFGWMSGVLRPRTGFYVSPVLVAGATLLLSLLVIHVAVGGGWSRAWITLGVPAMQPSFADLRTITHSLDAVRAGSNPYVMTDFDPWHRLYNYPPAWLWLAKTGLGARQTVPIGCCMGVLLFTCYYFIFKPATKTCGVISFFLVLSPPVLLGIERGNCDIIVFVVLVLGILCSVDRSRVVNIILRSISIILGTVIKIYPIAGIAVLIKTKSSIKISIAVGVLASYAFWFSLRPGDLTYVFGNTPQSTIQSYGSFPLVEEFRHILGINDPKKSRAIGSLLALTIASISFCASVKYREVKDRFLPKARTENFVDDIALTCCAIFCFTFIIGSNFDYRLIFLVATIPPFIGAYERLRSTTYLVLPCIVLFSLWLSNVSPRVVYIDELLNWIVFSMLSVWIASCLSERCSWPIVMSAL